MAEYAKRFSDSQESEIALDDWRFVWDFELANRPSVSAGNSQSDLVWGKDYNGDSLLLPKSKSSSFLSHQFEQVSDGSLFLVEGNEAAIDAAQSEQRRENYYRKIATELDNLVFKTQYPTEAHLRLESSFNIAANSYDRQKSNKPESRGTLMGNVYPNRWVSFGYRYPRKIKDEKEKTIEEKNTNSSDNSKEKKIRAIRGSGGITKDGRTRINNCSYILQEAFTKERLGFLTLTLPSFGELPNNKKSKDLAAKLRYQLAKDWDILVKRFHQELTRELKRKGAGEFPQYVSVTEIQESRAIRHKQFMPHLHCLYVQSDKNNKCYLSGKSQSHDELLIFKIWLQQIFNCLNRAREKGEIKFRDSQLKEFFRVNHIINVEYTSKAKKKPTLVFDVSVFMRLSPADLKKALDTKRKKGYSVKIKLESVKKDAGAYMAKYMSKGGKRLKDFNEKYSDLMPSCWYHIEFSLLHEFLDAVQPCDPYIMKIITDWQYPRLLSEDLVVLDINPGYTGYRDCPLVWAGRNPITGQLTFYARLSENGYQKCIKYNLSLEYECRYADLYDSLTYVGTIDSSDVINSTDNVRIRPECDCSECLNDFRRLYGNEFDIFQQ